MKCAGNWQKLLKEEKTTTIKRKRTIIERKRMMIERKRMMIERKRMMIERMKTTTHSLFRGKFNHTK
jgi:hypothetical protein